MRSIRDAGQAGGTTAGSSSRLLARARRIWSHRHEPVIRPHIGQVIERRLLLGGRVLVEGALAPASATTPRWQNLVNTWHSFVHRKLAGARLQVQFADARTEVTTDSEGYFSVEMELPAPVAGPLWQEVSFALVDRHEHHPEDKPVTAIGLVLVCTPSSRGSP
jgi:phosphatidate phosphatase APP1